MVELAGAFRIAVGHYVARHLRVCASFGGWLYALRFLPLGLAFALTNGVHIFVPIGSWYFLGDHIGLLRGSGICIIIVGILLLAQSVAKAEEKV